MAKRDYYEILGVSKSASDDEIKSAFRKLAKKYHPDVCKEADGASKFKEAQEAYAVLSDKNQRAKYDQYGHSAFDNMSGGGNPGGYDFSGFDFSNIFDEIFGNSGFSSFGGFGGFGGNKRTRATKGSDLMYRMSIDFEEAVYGTKKEFELEVTENCPECDGTGGFNERTCPDCDGSGYISQETRTILGSFVSKSVCPTCKGKGHVYKDICSKCHGKGKVKIKKDIVINVPKGIDTGEQLRLTGKGEAGNNGGPNGDLYIEINVNKHPLYTREGNDIYIELPVTFTDLALGTSKKIKTPHDFITLKIKEGSQPGEILRVKGKGIENENWGKDGDFFIILKLITPAKLTKEQKNILQELSETDLENSDEFKKFEKLNK